MIHSNLFLNCSPCEEESLNPPDVQRTSQLVSKLHSLLALVIGLLTCQVILKIHIFYWGRKKYRSWTKPKKQYKALELSHGRKKWKTKFRPPPASYLSLTPNSHK